MTAQISQVHIRDLAETVRHTATSPATVKRVLLYNAQLLAITEAECVRLLLDELEEGRGGWLMTMNLDHLRRLVWDRAYAALVARVDWMIADGMPLIWASRLQKTPLPERITGSNLIWSLSQGAAARGRSVFLLGGREYTAQQSARILQAAYPQLRVAGVYAPPMGFEQDAAEMEKLCIVVMKAQPDILYVALGSPKEDNLIAQLRESLPQTWCIGVGISFSWVSGELPRAPKWMQQAGLEWLHRLWYEPLRLGRRYLIDDLPFAAQLFAHALRNRWMRAQRHGE